MANVIVDALAVAKVAGRAKNTMIATLVGAMKAGLAVTFIYDGKERIVDAHAIGTSTKDGGLLLRGVQVGGSASRELPQWTLFRLDGIESLGLTFQHSMAPHEGYSTGDRQMGQVIVELAV